MEIAILKQVKIHIFNNLATFAENENENNNKNILKDSNKLLKSNCLIIKENSNINNDNIANSLSNNEIIKNNSKVEKEKQKKLKKKSGCFFQCFG